MSRSQLARRLTAEAIGAAMFLLAVVGSRIMGERLSGGNNGITFAVNTATCAAMAVALMFAFGTISGAHFNPAVSFASYLRGRLGLAEMLAFVAAQLGGGFVGVGAAILIYGRPVFRWSNPPRATIPEVAGECLATFGLICVLAGCARLRSRMTAFAVGGYLGATYWFTESTSFANPAVAIAKGLTSTSSSIHPGDISIIVTAQLLGAALAGLLFRWLSPSLGAAGAPEQPSLVVFACVHGGAFADAAAEAFAAQADPRATRAVAASPFPEAQLEPELLAALRGSSAQRASAPVAPRTDGLLTGGLLTDELLLAADLVVTIGQADEFQPFISGEHVHWALGAEALRSPEAAREAAEQLRVRVRGLVRGLGAERMRAVRLPHTRPV